MSQPRPKFIDSSYFVEEYGNWHLLDNAPEEVKKEFEQYMKESGTYMKEAPANK